MTEHRSEDPGGRGSPIPRDLPDQQADTDESAADEATDEAGPADDVPDTDEAGTRRRGAGGSDTVHPEHPDPDESPA